jgi:hypothetical protein
VRIRELRVEQLPGVQEVVDQERDAYERLFEEIYIKARASADRRWPALKRVSGDLDKCRRALVAYSVAVAHCAALEAFIMAHPTLHALVKEKA